MKTSATAKFVGTSPRKISLVAGLIRGRKVTEATEILAVTSKRATTPVGKVLASAVANAENNLNLKKADLTVEAVLVGPAGRVLGSKRFRPRSRGMATSINHRASHITVIINDGKGSKPAKPAAHQTEPQAETKEAVKAEAKTEPAKKPAAKQTKEAKE